MDINGVIIINKPQDMTSHDVVAIMRKRLQTKKIGHTGTLDPMATGVLPICVGKATKIVDFLMDRKKAYHCEMKLGSATDTQDQWGTITDLADASQLSIEEIESAVLSFVGEISQIPPMYSALKVGGEKLVDLARQGIVIDREARTRTIHAIDNIVVRQQTISFDVICSKGTYIRTLCHDIGLKLNCFGHMTALTRTFTEPFYLDRAIAPFDVDLDSIGPYVISIEEALAFLPSINVKTGHRIIEKVKNGVRIDFSKYLTIAQNDSEDRLYKIYIEHAFWGIGEKTEQGIFMKKVLIETEDK